MPEEQATGKKKKVLEPMFDVVRKNPNGDEVPLTFYKMEISKRSEKRAGEIYPAPHVTKENVNTVLEWIGIDNLVGTIQALLKKKSQGWLDECKDDETGEPNFAKFKASAELFSAISETMADLKEQQDDLMDELVELDSEAENYDEEKDRILNELRRIKVAMNEKKRPRKEAAETEVASA